MFYGFLNGPLGDFIEHDAVDRFIFE